MLNANLKICELNNISTNLMKQGISTVSAVYEHNEFLWKKVIKDKLLINNKTTWKKNKKSCDCKTEKKKRLSYK